MCCFFVHQRTITRLFNGGFRPIDSEVVDASATVAFSNDTMFTDIITMTINVDFGSAYNLEANVKLRREDNHLDTHAHLNMKAIQRGTWVTKAAAIFPVLMISEFFLWDISILSN